MLELYFENNKLDLGNLQGVSLQMNGGVFNFETLPGSYSIPFTLPASEINNVIFGFPFDSGDVIDVIKGNAYIKHSGVILSKGLLSLSRFDNKTINCNFSANNNSFNNQIKDKEMTDIDYGDDRDFVRIDFETIEGDAGIPKLTNHVFFNDFLSSSGTTPEETIQNYAAGIGDHTEPFIVTPFPKLHIIIKYLFKYFGYLYNETFFEQEPFNKLLIYSNNNIVKVGEYPDGSTKYYEDTWNLKNHVPNISIKNFIISIQNFFNIFFRDNNGNIDIIDRTFILLSSDYIDISNKIQSQYSKKINNLKNGFILNLEKDTNDELMNHIESITDLIVTWWFDETPPPTYYNAIDLLNYDYVAYQKTETIPLTGDPYEKPTVILRDIGHDNPLSTDYYPDIIWSNMAYTLINPLFDNNKGVNIPIYMTSVLEGYVSGTTCPTVYAFVKGNSFFELNQKTGFRLMLLDAIDLCNVVSTGRYNPNISGYDFAISPVWSYEQRWETFLNWYQDARKIEYIFDINFTIADLKNFDFTKKYKIGNHLYFIKSFTVSLTITGIKPAKCICIRV